MTSCLVIAGIGLSTAAFGQQGLADVAADQRCAKGADVRRIEIRFADADDGLPCKVVYRPEAESDTLGIVSWQDLESVEACQAQASEVVGRLTVEGWNCAPDGDAERADHEAIVELFTAETEADDQVLQSTAAVTPDVAEAPDAPDETGVDTTATSPAEVLPDAAPVIDGEDENFSDDEIDRPAEVITNPDLPPPSDDLAAMIEEDLARLDATLDGLLEATIAGYGDLNADDIDDALVLYTYRSPQPAYRQFLAAYVSDGEIHQLTATRPVSGSVSATIDARVEAIDRGVVHLALKAFEPGDASCCPSGTRYLALTLRDLELVKIDSEAPTR